MFLRFTLVWLSCPKLFEVCWSSRGLDNSCMRMVWFRGNFLFCLSDCVFKSNSTLVDSSRAFHKKHAFSKRVSWSYRLFFFFLLFNQPSQQLYFLTRCMFTFVGEASFCYINHVSVMAYCATFVVSKVKEMLDFQYNA